ncbi:hypothetical protein ACRRTK_004028 [Alexandromys fortis]
MPANLTEGSSPANQTMPMLDASPVACTEIATFTEVLAAEEWGSFYSSFKSKEGENMGPRADLQEAYFSCSQWLATGLLIALTDDPLGDCCEI